MIVIPYGASADALRFFVQDLVLRLYTNDRTPAESDKAADYTEAKGAGYAAIALAAADWSVLEGPPPLARAREKAFVFTGALGPVYGYYLTRTGTGRIAFAERFATTPDVKNNGDRIKVAAVLSFSGKKGA